MLATSFAFRHPVLHLHHAYCKHAMLMASSQYLSGPEVLFVIVERLLWKQS